MNPSQQLSLALVCPSHPISPPLVGQRAAAAPQPPCATPGQQCRRKLRCLLKVTADPAAEAAARSSSLEQHRSHTAQGAGVGSRGQVRLAQSTWAARRPSPLQPHLSRALHVSQSRLQGLASPSCQRGARGAARQPHLKAEKRQQAVSHA